MKKVIAYALVAVVALLCILAGFSYVRESKLVAVLQETQKKLEAQKVSLGEYSENCEVEIESDIERKEITVNCAPAAYCICAKLNTPFFTANSSSELCAESKLDTSQRFYCVSNKPGGQK